ncbi:MAG: glycoside hydrolase family 88 protein [Planctomycetaceae bacterium]|nr:glycoside hydrolase family 88 protein [Planctomycetaceae bacterium]
MISNLSTVMLNAMRSHNAIIVILVLLGEVLLVVMAWRSPWIIALTVFLQLFFFWAGTKSTSIAKLLRRFHEPSFPWNELTPPYVARVQAFAKTLLEDPSIEATEFGFRGASFRRAGANSAAVNGWENACLLNGYRTALRYAPQDNDIEIIERFCGRIIDPKGRFKTDPKTVDQCMIGEALLDLFEKTQKDAYRSSVATLAEVLMKVHARTSSGTLPYRKTSPQIVLVDAIPMVSPFLVRYGNMFQSSEAVELGVHQCREFLQCGLEYGTNLPYHGYYVGRPGGLGAVAWGRGCGWFALGLSGVLTYLSPQTEHHQYLLEGFRKVVRSMCDYQLKGGGWAWCLPFTSPRAETSATATIACGIQRGIDIGALDGSYADTVQGAIRALVAATDAQGVVTGGHGVSLGAGTRPLNVWFSRWTQGCTMALATMLTHSGEGVR